MADEPTPGELGRRLDDRTAELRQDLADLARRIDSKVSADVYQIQHAATMQEIGVIKAELTAQEVERARDRDRIATTRRWLIGAVIVPIVAVIVAYLLSRGGTT